MALLDNSIDWDMVPGGWDMVQRALLDEGSGASGEESSLTRLVLLDGSEELIMYLSKQMPVLATSAFLTTISSVRVFFLCEVYLYTWKHWS